MQGELLLKNSKTRLMLDLLLSCILVAMKEEKKGSSSLRDRARQNVIFEHGYLCAKLGRNRVVALNNDDIEIPSDLAGILYIPHSSTDWKMNLIREMQNAGLDFSLTKA